MDPLDKENVVRGMHFISPATGYVAFKNKVGFTTDSGHTYTWKNVSMGNVDYATNPVNLTFGFHQNGVKAIDQQTILAYGHYGWENTILRSVDGGNTYRVVFYRPLGTLSSKGVTDISLAPGNAIAYAVDNDLILKSTNGGSSWSAVYSAANTFFSHVQAIDNNTVIAYSGVAAGTESTHRLFRSANGGLNWQRIALPPGQLYSAYFITSARGWVSMGSGFYLTTNGGATWVRQDNPETPFTGSNLYFPDEQTGYALNELVYKTTNGGQYWEPLNNQPALQEYQGLNQLYGYSSTQLWTGGTAGQVQLTTNGGGTPRPNIYFGIDTTGFLHTRKLQLVNHSKTSYTFRWFRNDTLIGTSYKLTTDGRGYPFTDKIKLVASNGTYTDTLSQDIYYTEPASISSFAPAAVPVGGTVTIKGSWLGEVTGVFFGGIPATSFHAVDFNTVTAVVGSGASGDITVVTPNRGIASIAGFVFLPPPIITSFTPKAVATGSSITITGNYFQSVTEIRVGGIRVTNYTVVSPTTITVPVPSGPSGDIEIKTIAGSTRVGGYTALPGIRAFAPTSGVAGSQLRISGSSLLEVTGITIGGVPVANFTIHSADSISVKVGAGASGSVVVTSGGGVASRSGYTLLEPPVITSFAPQSGTVGSTVTISGSNFDPVATNNLVYFGTAKATVTGASTTSLTVTVPGGAIRERISVSNRSLTAFTSTPFNVLFTIEGTITPGSFAKQPVLGLHQFERELLVQGVGDLDGDGKQDIVTSNVAMPFSLLFARNTSSGINVSFEEVTGNQGFASAIAIGDLNGDSRPEMVFDWSGSISVYPNVSTSGHIRFEEGINFGGQATEAFGNINIVDIDKDGKADIVKSANGQLLIYRNIGEQGIFAFETITIPFNGINAIVYDVNEDGLIDLVQYDRTGNTISIHRNTSTKGTVSFAAPIIIIADSPMAIDITDIDHDGKPDIAVASANNGKLQLFRNTIQGTNLSFAPSQDISLGAALYDVSLVDLNGDGLPDLTASSDKYQFTNWINHSTPGNFDFDQPVHHSPDDYVFKGTRFMIQTGDFNGDGRPDLMLMSKNTAHLDLYINQAKGQPYIDSWSPDDGATKGATITIKGKLFTGTTAVGFGGVPAASFTVVDDTTIKAVLGEGASGMISTTNAGGTTEKAGFLYGAKPVITGFSPANGPVGSQVVLSGSGFDPVASKNIVYFGGVKTRTVASTGNTLTVVVPAGSAAPGAFAVTSNSRTAVSSKGFSVTFPNDNRDFSDTSFVNIGIPGGFAGVASDFDQDGKNDLVVSPTNALFGIARNTSSIGQVSFEPAITFGQGEQGSAYAAGDLDGDGRIDIVVTGNTNNLFHVFRNTSTGNQLSFVRDSTYSIFEGPVRNGVTIADIDHDGIPEIVGFTFYSRRVFVFKNYSSPGKTAFAPRQQFYAGGDPIAIGSDDLDRDGKQEVLSYTQGLYSDDIGISALRNTGTNNTINLESKGGVGFMYSHQYAFGDFDADGLLDVAGNHRSFPNINIGRNEGTPGKVAFRNVLNPIFVQGEYSAGFTVADLNGDGKADIVLISDKGFSLFRNTSSPGVISMEPRKIINIPGAWGSYYPMDVDGDGAVDLVAGGNVMLNKMYTGAPSEVLLCAGADTSLQAGSAAAGYQWQQDTGTGFGNITDNAHFTGTTTAKLELNNIPSSWNAYRFRTIDNNGTPGQVFILKIQAADATASVTIATPSLEVCTGANVVFTATPVNGGNAPTYQWYVNGQATGTNSGGFTKNTLADGDEVKVTMTGNAACITSATVTSNTIRITVNAMLTPAVTIALDPASGCQGEPAKFIATPVNGGLAPTYTWMRNGMMNPDDNGTFTWALIKGDVIQAVMFSGLSCRTDNTALSNVLMIGGNAPGDPQLPLEASVSITADATGVCAGEAITFQANAVNGGTTPAYQWQVNGVNVGNNSATFTSNQLKAGDVIHVSLTSSEACTLAATVVSSDIILKGADQVIPAVSISASSTNICVGSAITFTAIPVNGGNAPAYTWKVNEVVVSQTGPTFTSSTLQNGDKVSVVLTSNAACKTGATATSEVVTVTVSQLVTPTITIQPSATEVCPATTVQFTATVANAGANPQIVWSDGKTTGNTYGITNIQVDTEVYATLTTTDACVSNKVVNSLPVIIRAKTTAVPLVTISASSQDICPGTPVTFTTTVANASSSPTFQWFIGEAGGPPGSGNTFTYSHFNNGERVTVKVTARDACETVHTVSSNTITINVGGSQITPSVSITASATVVCAGIPVTFTATPVNGGTAPVYQWQVDGVNAGSNSNTFISSTLTNGAVVRVVLTSNAGCLSTTTATSNGIPVSISSTTAPTIAITGSKSNICAGTEVTFTATSTNGGTTPSYQWQVNGVNVGTNSTTYTASNLTDGAQVKLLLTSNSPCASATPVSSNTINMVVMSASAVTATISGNNTLEANNSTVLAVTMSRTGSTSTYQWQDSTSSIGWQPIAGATSASITYTPAETGDKVRCLITTNATCMASNTVTSNTLTFVVNTPNSGRIAPNPVDNVLNIGQLNLDDQWQTAEIASVSAGNRLIVQSVAGQTTVSIPVAKLSKGLYIVLLRSKTGATKQIKFIKQ